MECERGSSGGWPDGACERRAPRGKSTMGQHKGSVFTASSTAPAPLTGRELCAKCLEVSTECAQRQAKPEQCAPLPQPARIVGSVAGGGERNLGQTHENPWFSGGRTNPSRFCASGGGAAIPKLSRLCQVAAGGSRDAGQSEHSIIYSMSAKIFRVRMGRNQNPWLQDRHAKCSCVCREGHVDRAVKHDGSEEANPSCIFGLASKAAPVGKRSTALPSQPHMLSSLG